MRRLLASLAAVRSPPAGFTYFPHIFSDSEQRTLLSAALAHLDAAASTAASRRRRRKLLESGSVNVDEQGFLPEKLYDFEPGHFDGVIKKYRESRITDVHWDSLVAADARLGPVLAKLRAQLPQELSVHQSHVLHLASDGEILPHVDNVDASGSLILGVSLGSPRILRLESGDDGDCYELLLEPGSCYIQRDLVRYTYKHSILKPEPSQTNPGQRLSIMLRDLPTSAT